MTLNLGQWKSKSATTTINSCDYLFKNNYCISLFFLFGSNNFSSIQKLLCGYTQQFMHIAGYKTMKVLWVTIRIWRYCLII